MRGRMLLWVSFGLNIALAVWLWRTVFSPTESPVSTAALPFSVLTTNQVRTNVVVRRQNFVWSQIESDDYAAFIANLRKIGCPEATIRDIILADINQLFAKRRAAEVVTAAQQWWRSDPDPEVTRAAIAKIRALEDERRSLLVRLLGPEWESSAYPYPPPSTAAPLDGPILGNLSPQTRVAVHRIEQASLDRQQAYLEAEQQAGRAPDPAELARLRQQSRAELARALTPEQLEEYLLRYSNNANQLRAQLHGLETSPEEFRTLFRRVDVLDQQLLASTGDDPSATRRREDLGRQREAALKDVLGAERYQDYKLNQDPLYRQARSIAEQAGASEDKILPLAAINRLTDLEEQRIRNDGGLTVEEMADRLQAARQARQDSLRKLLGDDAYQRYQERQTVDLEQEWLAPTPNPQPRP